MNAPAAFVDAPAPGCRELALAALGALLPDPADPAAEARFLREAWQRCGAAAWPQQLAQALAGGDGALQQLAARLHLSPAELLAVALVASVEDDPVVGRVLAWLQGGSPRPSLALLARALAPLEPAAAGCSEAQAEALLPRRPAQAAALRAGALQLQGEDRPLCERTLAMPAPIAAVLAGVDADWPGAPLPQPADTDALDLDTIAAWADRLRAGGDAALLVRCSSLAEAQALAVALAARLQRRPAWFGPELPPGADLWLALGARLPVFMLPTAPLQVQAVPALQHHRAPVLVLAGADGGVRRDDGVLAEWRVPPAGLGLRRRVWAAALGDTPLAERASRRHRGAAAHVSEQARLARLLGADSDAQVAEAARLTAACRALDALAESLPAPVADDALVAGEALRAELQRVRQRCEQREGLAEGLGAALQPCGRRRAPAVHRRVGHGQDAGRSGWPRRYRCRCTAWTCRPCSASGSARPEEPGRTAGARRGRRRHAAVRREPTRCSASARKFRRPTTASPTRRPTTCCSASRSHAGIVVLTSNRSRFDPTFVRRLDFIVDFPRPMPRRGGLGRTTWARLHAAAGAAEPAGGRGRQAAATSATRCWRRARRRRAADHRCRRHRRRPARRIPASSGAPRHQTVGDAGAGPAPANARPARRRGDTKPAAPQAPGRAALPAACARRAAPAARPARRDGTALRRDAVRRCARTAATPRRSRRRRRAPRPIRCGSDIVFGAGRYARPRATDAGCWRELTHVVQQRRAGGAVQRSVADGGARRASRRRR